MHSKEINKEHFLCSVCSQGQTTSLAALPEMYTIAFLLTKARQIAEFQFEFWNLKDEGGGAFYGWEVKWNVKVLQLCECCVCVYMCVHVEMCMWRCTWILPVGSYPQCRSGKMKGEFHGFCHTVVAFLHPNTNSCSFFFPLLTYALRLEFHFKFH